MKCLSVCLSACLVVLAMGSATADEVYFDRSDFIAAVEDPTLIDFEDQPIGPVVGDPWLGLGVVFDEAGVGDNMAIGDGGGFDMNIYAAGGQDADIDVTFPAQGASACGLDVFSNDIQVAGERLVFFGEGDIVLADLEMPLTGYQSSAFVGYVADVVIVRVAFIEDDGDADYVGIGELIFKQQELSSVESVTWTRIKRLYSE